MDKVVFIIIDYKNDIRDTFTRSASERQRWVLPCIATEIPRGLDTSNHSHTRGETMNHPLLALYVHGHDITFGCRSTSEI
jgi:hypothetical protein